MKVTITNPGVPERICVKGGWFSSVYADRYVVTTTVQLDNAEKKALNKQDLSVPLYFRDMMTMIPPSEWKDWDEDKRKVMLVTVGIPISMFLKSPRRDLFHSPQLALAFEKELHDKILPTLKELIDCGMVGPRTTVVEL